MRYLLILIKNLPYDAEDINIVPNLPYEHETVSSLEESIRNLAPYVKVDYFILNTVM